MFHINYTINCLNTNCHINYVALLMSQTELCRTCNNSPFAHCLSQFMQRVSEIILTVSIVKIGPSIISLLTTGDGPFEAINFLPKQLLKLVGKAQFPFELFVPFVARF